MVDVRRGIYVRPCDPQPRPTDVDESSDTWDTIEWLVNHVASYNGKVGMWDLLSGILRGHGYDRRPSGADGRCPGGRFPTLRGRRRHHNGAYALPRIQLHGLVRATTPATGQESAFTFDHDMPRATSSFWTWAPCRTPTRDTSRMTHPWSEYAPRTYDDVWTAQVCPHLKAIRPAVMLVGLVLRRGRPFMLRPFDSSRRAATAATIASHGTVEPRRFLA